MFTYSSATVNISELTASTCTLVIK